jgi:serine/threonine protein kinase
MFLLRVIAVIITSLVILALTWWGWTSSSSVAWISTSSTATSSAPHNLNEKYTETRLPPVALLDVLAEGDIIKNEFILHQRLDFLGVKSSHVSEDSSFLLAGSTTSPSIELAQTASSPMKDISLFKQAFRVDDENIESVKNDFHLNEKVFFGGHGEIWLAHKIFAGEVDLNQTYILKRMNLRNRPDILRCALREIYFGELLQHDPRTTHLVAHFLHDNDYWLAFEDEGVSLQQLLYAVSFTATATLLEPSAIWKNLRSSKEGDDSFKSILYQIIKGVENLHSKGILHRDIKPSNLLINAKNKSGDFGGIRLLISDYSSAVSELALRSGLYGVLDENGDDHAQDYPPSVDEESPQYMPPEVTFSCFDFSTKSHSSNRGDNKVNSGVGTHSSSFISPPDNDQQREEAIGEENGSPLNEKCEPIAYDAYRPESYDIWSIGDQPSPCLYMYCNPKGLIFNILYFNLLLFYRSGICRNDSGNS